MKICKGTMFFFMYFKMPNVEIEIIIMSSSNFLNNDYRCLD